MSAIESYPLAWPVGMPRTHANKRQRAKFHRKVESTTIGNYTYKRKSALTLYQGVSQVRDELATSKATDVVISTNVKTRKDGLPYSGAAEPEDPGVAVYFRLGGETRCLQCDRWDRVADNLSAIAHHIEAMRKQSLWGVGNQAQAWAGYKALPAMDAKNTWWAILGFRNPPEVLATVEAKWRERIEACHPDRGGSANQAAEVNAAWSEAKRFYAVSGT